MNRIQKIAALSQVHVIGFHVVTRARKNENKSTGDKFKQEGRLILYYQAYINNEPSDKGYMAEEQGSIFSQYFKK